MGKAKGKHMRQVKRDISDIHWMGHRHTDWGGLQLQYAVV
jgi:hypothetical protein